MSVTAMNHFTVLSDDLEATREIALEVVPPANQSAAATNNAM